MSTPHRTNHPTRHMHRFTAILLTMALITSLFLPFTAAATQDATEDLTKYPTVRLAGAKWALWNNYQSKDRSVIYIQDDGVPVPDGYIAAQAKILIPKLMRAVVTNDYTDYANGLVDAVADIYAAREQFDPTIPPELIAEKISANGVSARAISGNENIADYLKNSLSDGDIAVIMGAGDIFKIYDHLK